MRTITVNDQEYQWKAGRSHVLIRQDGRKFACPSFADITGMKWHDIEHDQHKGNFHVSPSQVANYVAATAPRRHDL